MNKTSVLTSLYSILQPNKTRLEGWILNLAVGDPKDFFWPECKIGRAVFYIGIKPDFLRFLAKKGVDIINLSDKQTEIR